MIENGASVQCCCQRPLELAFHTFEDGVVVYDEADGSLHVLNPIAGEALGHLVRCTELSDVALARLVLEGEPEPLDLEQIRELMNSLVSLGFAEHAAK